MNNNPEFYIDHETRLRLVEQNCVDIKNALVNLDAKMDAKLSAFDAKFMHLENKIHNTFTTIVGIILTAFILPIIFHALHWI